MVARYDLEIYAQGAAGQCDMEKRELGDYVLYTDYQKLEERIKELEQRISDQGWEIEFRRETMQQRIPKW